ncbi:MAG: DUF1015 domain-containing protein [Verrucomicrobiota bacterium]
MLRVKPFQGLRPADDLVHLVACVPYDVVDAKEAAALTQDNPYSLMHVDRAEIDLPAGTDPYSAMVYEKARETFQTFQQHEVLVREPEPCIYLYQQRMGNHTQTGIALTCHIEDYERDIIKKHEKTRRDKEDDRTRLIDTISADTGPVFLTYRDTADLDALVAEVLKGAPLYDFVAPDGIGHTVWRVPGTKLGQFFVDAFAQVPVAYVADGHHRTASAVRVGKERREKNPNHTGDEPYNWFLCVLFPASQLRILPYNRCVHDLNGRTPEEFLDAVRAAGFTISENAYATPTQPGQIRMYIGGAWYGLTWAPQPNANPIERLDVTVLQDRLLAPILGIDDPRTSHQIDFIGGIRGTGELVQRVDEGRGVVAFSMFPTTVEQLMDIADADQIMPPKSTWFEPKLRSGLFVHTLE